MKALQSLAILAGVIGCLATPVRAQQEAVNPPPNAGDLFVPSRLSLDLFGTYADRDRFGESVRRGGGGLGLDYFLTRHVGIGADSYLEEWKAPYRVNGSLILRLPLAATGPGLAPYALGGGGREFKFEPQYTWHGGGGLEFRFDRYTGIFGDIRRVFPAHSGDYTLIRAGLRLGF